MAPFDRSYTTFYWSPIVNMALSATVFKLFDVEWYHDLEIWVRGHSGSLKPQTGTIWKVGCGFLFAFHSNYGSILHQFRDKARYWSKIVIFSYPPLHWTRRNTAIPFGTGKLEWCGYPMVKNFKDMYNRLDSIPACDRRTDRQTSCHGIVRTMHTRRAVKIQAVVSTSID